VENCERRRTGGWQSTLVVRRGTAADEIKATCRSPLT
jgi:hypothetical protein